jgi:hypothetical protein
MDEETNTLVAKWYLAQSFYGRVSAKDFSDWAIHLLEQGLDSKNIRILASMFNVDIFLEVEDYFRRSLKDLDWQFPNIEECLLRYAKLIATEIINQSIEPFEGCEIIHKINNALDYPSILGNWVSLYWAGNELYWEGETVIIENLNKQIIQEAERFLNGKTFIFSEKVEDKQMFSEVTEKESFLSKVWRKLF